MRCKRAAEQSRGGASNGLPVRNPRSYGREEEEEGHIGPSGARALAAAKLCARTIADATKAKASTTQHSAAKLLLCVANERASLTRAACV